MTTWPMVEDEADDGLATVTARFVGDPRVEQVVICSVDKDLAQCVRGAGRPARPDAEGHLRRGRRGRQVRRLARRAFPTTWPWSATPRTAIPACRAGAPRAPRPCSPARSTWRRSPTRRWMGRAGPRRGAPGGHPARPRAEAALYQRLATLDADAARGTSTTWRGTACRAPSSWRCATSWASTPSAPRASLARRGLGPLVGSGAVRCTVRSRPDVPTRLRGRPAGGLRDPDQRGARPARAGRGCLVLGLDLIGHSTAHHPRLPARHRRGRDGELRAYTKNVLSREWIGSWTAESLRSGALAVKHYAWYQVLHWRGGTNADGQCFDLRDDTVDQVYDPSKPTWTTAAAAVDATWSMRVLKNGEIFPTYYNAGTPARHAARTPTAGACTSGARRPAAWPARRPARSCSPTTTRASPSRVEPIRIRRRRRPPPPADTAADAEADRPARRRADRGPPELRREPATTAHAQADAQPHAGPHAAPTPAYPDAGPGAGTPPPSQQLPGGGQSGVVDAAAPPPAPRDEPEPREPTGASASRAPGADLVQGPISLPRVLAWADPGAAPGRRAMAGLSARRHARARRVRRRSAMAAFGALGARRSTNWWSGCCSSSPGSDRRRRHRRLGASR